MQESLAVVKVQPFFPTIVTNNLLITLEQQFKVVIFNAE
jgi:hypothetical protein